MHLDLNLLVALDALLDTGSVGGAAARLHVTSPAMSRTLDRIRHMTGDPILVRAGRHMAPTPYALAVRDDVHDVVQRARAVLAQRQAFDLSTLERTFTVQCHDALLADLGGRLLMRLQQAAPRSSLRMLAEGAAEGPELRHGPIDLHIGANLPSQPDILHAVLGEDRLEVAMRASHPLAARKPTLRRYAAAEHVIVSRRGKLRDPVDDVLEQHGLARRVAASAPSVAVGLAMAGAADLLVVVPTRVCGPAARALRLITWPLPFDTAPVSVVASWHRRHDADRAHAWLRQAAGEIVGELLAAGG